VNTPELWWNRRRPKIVELLEREVYGRIPAAVPAVRWEVRQTREVESGGKTAIQRQLVGVVGLVNHGQPRSPDQWGALRAWGWGAARALDHLETVPEVDAKRVGIAGVSRYGKAALVAMAFDQRFALGLIASSGAGGTALYRRDFGESPENLASSGAYHWMAGNYLRYAAEESSFGRRTAADLPVDSHMTIALCAPRLTFISHGIPEQGDAHWLDHRGSFMAAVAAQPVFRLLGARGLARGDDYLSERMPDVNVDRLDGALAWRQHDGGHTDEPNVVPFIRWAEARWAEAQDQPVPGNARGDSRSLKEAVGDRFKIGVGVGHQVLGNAEDAALIRRHFQILTPENCMKPQAIQPAENEWNFAAADRFVDFARSNQLEVVGHCLVWAKDDRTDAWMKQENGQPVSRETLLRRLETHIHTVVGRYADAATMWDVVNEAIGDGDEGVLRDSVYSRTTGLDFIVTAFKAARAADPDALLIYNDYNGHKPGKRRGQSSLLTHTASLFRRSRPLGCLGRQQVRHMRPCPHLQPLRDPRQCHRRLRPQPPRNAHLAGITLAPPAQVRLRPALPGQFLPHQSLRLGFPALLAFPSVVLRPHSLRSPGQQFFLELWRPKEPAPPDGPPFLVVAFLTSRLRLPFQLPPARRTVLGQPHLPQQPFHPQPRPAPARRLEVFRVTAPNVIPQRLLRRQQLRPRRIQMHILADGAEVTRRLRVHQQRPVPSAEQVPNELVPAVEAAGVGAEKPGHPSHEVGLGCLHHQMKMIAHQAEGVDLPLRLGASLDQGLEKPRAVGVVAEDGLTAVTSIHDVVNRTFKFDAQRSWHTGACQNASFVSIVRTASLGLK
jgi:hypothetical protein